MSEQSFEEFLAQNMGGKINLVSFSIAMALAFVCSLVLGFLYVKFGRNPSNRSSFSSNFGNRFTDVFGIHNQTG